MNGYWMGLDIGGTKCAVLLAQMQQGITIVDKLRFDTRDRFQSAYDRLCEGVVTLLERHHLTREQIRGISISCGGP